MHYVQRMVVITALFLATTTAMSVGPSIASLSPTSGAVGAVVEITGNGFGAMQGTSTVTFNGRAATPMSWSDKSIVVPVPPGAATGKVVVTVSRKASNDVLFTVVHN
jgi:IPT/TIG domain-containing protein